MPSKISGYSPADAVAPLKGTNPSAGVVAEKTQSDASTAASTSQTGDHVTLTDSARSLQKLSDTIAQAPVVNASKVASVKQAVSGGTYQIDTGRVADKILQFDNGLK